MKSTSWESDRERERMVEGLNDSASLTKNRAEVHFRWPVCNDDDTVARQRATPLPDAHMYLGVHTRCKSAADTRDYVCTPWAARVVPIVSVRASGRGNSHAGKGTSPDGIRGETADSCIDLPLLLFFVRQIYEFHIPFSLSLSLSHSLVRYEKILWKSKYSGIFLVARVTIVVKMCDKLLSWEIQRNLLEDR